MSQLKYILLNLPNPQGKNINREFAGGFGTLGTISSEIMLPTYLLYAASAIENSGYDFEIIDAQSINFNSFQVIKEIVEKKTDVLITWVSLPSLDDDLEFLCKIKKALPSALIIVLGAISNVMPEKILNAGCVDITIKGTYPHYNLVLNLVQVLNDYPLNEDKFDMIGGASYCKGGSLKNNQVEPFSEDLNHLSLELYRKLPIERYIGKFEAKDGSTIRCVPIISAVGCPHSCIYCPYPVGYGKRAQIKSIENIIEEIMFLKENFGIKGFMFRDQNFTRNEKRILDLCDAIIEKELDIKWLIESRVDQVTEKLLLRMREAGCFRIHYGVETGDPKILKNTGKPGLAVEDVKNAFSMTKDAGIFAFAHMIIGLPGESKKTLEYTFTLLKEINPDNVNLNILTPYPGTELYKIALEHGWIMSEDWSDYTSFNAVMIAGDLDVRELDRAKREIKSKFRNWKIMNDPIYRKFFIKSLPRKIRNRIIK